MQGLHGWAPLLGDIYVDSFGSAADFCPQSDDQMDG